MSRTKKMIAFILALVISLTLFPIQGYCGQLRRTVNLVVNGEDAGLIRVIDYDYDGNLYLSMRDLGQALNKTDMAFEVELTENEDGESVFVLGNISGDDSVAADDSGQAEDKEAYVVEAIEENEDITITRKRMFVEMDGHIYSFYVMPNKDEDGQWDVYVSLGEFSLAKNVQTDYSDGVISINTENEFDLNNEEVLKQEFMYMTDSCLVGDVTSGTIYAESNADMAVSMASTTKLMTYLVIKDAIAAGEISDTDFITISKEAVRLSETSSGTVPMKEGQFASMEDTLKGLLICSSNECALALAEHLCGNEAAFVERMNAKAKELELSENTRFYNSNGLPVYEDDVLNAKLQNHTTAEDMFKLAGYILEKYPEIKDITTIKKCKLVSFGNVEISSTNQLLYNLDNCVGLKTGTTDKAQSCLVSACEVTDLDGSTHYLVAVVYGAENYQTQGYVSMVLQKLALQKFNASELGITPVKNDEDYMPTSLEDLVGCVLNKARKE